MDKPASLISFAGPRVKVSEGLRNSQDLSATKTWMTQFEFKQHYGRNLPHIQPPGATLFVTFRLAGSIPKSVQEQWLREKRLLESQLLRQEAIRLPGKPDTDAKERLLFQRRWFGKFEALLRANVAGSCLAEGRPCLRNRSGSVASSRQHSL